MKINTKQHVTKQGIVKRNPGKVNTYLEFKQKMQRDLDKFPIVFAFNEEQLKEGLKKLGVSKDKVVGVFGGGIIRASDKEKFVAMLEQHDREHKEMIKNKSYVYHMFRYELANHEYGYTGDDTDTLSSLGLTKAQVNNNPLLKEQLEKAKRGTK
jgi:hypothetical protein